MVEVEEAEEDMAIEVDMVATNIRVHGLRVHQIKQKDKSTELKLAPQSQDSKTTASYNSVIATSVPEEK